MPILAAASLGAGIEPALLMLPAAQQISAAAERYISALKSLAPEARHITDKMPHNYLHLARISIDSIDFNGFQLDSIRFPLISIDFNWFPLISIDFH